MSTTHIEAAELERLRLMMTKAVLEKVLSDTAILMLENKVPRPEDFQYVEETITKINELPPVGDSVALGQAIGLAFRETADKMKAGQAPHSVGAWFARALEDVAAGYEGAVETLKGNEP